MYLSEYQKLSVENFMGWWNRGSLDDVPADHASDILNMAFARKREVVTRPAASFSEVLPNGLPVVRMFEAAFDNEPSGLIPLACDGNGNIWRLDTYTVLLNLPPRLNPDLGQYFPGMIDFDALNMNNHVYIAPMRHPLAPFDAYQDVIRVWSQPSFPVRLAAGGRPPELDFAAALGGGNAGPGYYGIAYSYVFDTGYVSPPSITFVTPNIPANSIIQVGDLTTVSSSIPNPPGVSGYIIYATQGQDNPVDAGRAALYEVETVTDLSNPVVNLNFFDTDLVIIISADPANGNLQNSMPYLPSATPGAVALIKYNGRMVIIGPNIIYSPLADSFQQLPSDYTSVTDNRIFISHPGAPENFDNLTGYVVIDNESDGNIPRTGFALFGSLFITKAYGIWATNDTGADPNDPTNPWQVVLIDGGIGAYHHSIGTIFGSQTGLSFNSTAFLANRNGLFLFNGTVQRPELSFKIRAIWERMVVDSEYQTRVVVDINNDLFYVYMPIYSPTTGVIENIILSGDYSLGLDPQNIRWTIYSFPWNVYDIIMASWTDPLGQSTFYLRLGSDGIIYKLDHATSADEIWGPDPGVTGGATYLGSTPINNYYQCAPMILGDTGALNICRFIRYRMAGQGTMFTTLQDQGEYLASEPLSQLVATVNVNPMNGPPGNYRDFGIQTNFTNEKVIVKFAMNGINDAMIMARVDVFGKSRWPTRPNA